MESRRDPWLTSSLELLFRDTEVKRTYRHNTRRAIANQLTNRVFDHFDSLLPRHELIDIAKKFILLLQEIKTFSNQEGETADLETTQQASLATELLSDIINIGIFELFDEQKKIRPDLIKLLNWEEFTDTINYARLLTAYVGSVFQSIYVTFPKSIDELAPARQCAEKYINQHYRNQVVMTLLRHQLITQASANAELKPAARDERILSPKPISTGIVAGSLTTLAGLAFGIYSAVKLTYHSSANASDDQTEKPQPGRTPNK